MRARGFYIIKDEFFEEMADPYIKGNKAENRPHYYCFEDVQPGIYWMIPLSSNLEKYKRIIQRKEAAGRPCDILHIARLDDGRESAFLIQDMFPITKRYIKREYTLAGQPFRVTSDRVALEIDRKAAKVLRLLKSGVKFIPTQPDVMAILEKVKDMV